MDEELKTRIDEYADRVNLRAKLRARRMSQQLSTEVGEEVLMPPHVRALAYLLGFEDNTSEASSNAFEVGLTKYKQKILPLIPASGIVNSPFYRPGRDRKDYLEVVFKRSAVENAFRALDEKGLVRYSKERFAEALQYVR